MPKASPRDEEKWEKAKKISEEAGRPDDYKYIMGIYKRMRPDYFSDLRKNISAMEDSFDKYTESPSLELLLELRDRVVIVETLITISKTPPGTQPNQASLGESESKRIRKLASFCGTECYARLRYNKK